MAFLGPLLGGGASLVSAILGAQSAQNEANINWASLQETKRRNREEEGLAKSDRRDAYGNKLHYEPGVGWTIDTTDLTNSILSGEQKQQRENLLEDAPRNRAANVRKDERSKMADSEFEKAFNEYKFKTPRSEAADVTDATTGLLNARKKGLDESGALLARQLIRTGQGSNLQGLYKSLGDQYAGSLEEAILKGKEVGKANYRDETNQDENLAQGKLGFLRGIADDTSNPGASITGLNSSLTGRSDQAQADLIRAIESARGASQSAYGTYANSVGRTGLDLSGLAAALGRMDFSGGGDSGDQRYPIPPNDPTTGEFDANAWYNKHPGIF